MRDISKYEPISIRFDKDISKLNLIYFPEYRYYYGGAGQIQQESLLPESCVCGSCWEELYEFHKFYVRLEQTHNDNRIVIKLEAEHLPNVSKSKEVLLKSLLEPANVISQHLNESFEIKQEHDEPFVVVVDNREYDEDEDNENEPHPLELIYYSSESNSSDNDNEEDDQTDSDEDHSSLIHETNNQHSEEITSNSNTTKEANNDDNEDKGNDKKRKNSSSNASQKIRSCSKRFASSNDKFLFEHFKLTCDKCQKPFNRFRLLCQHFSQEHNEQGYAMCCNTKFFNRSLLVDHINYHLDPEYLKCKVCGKVFAKRKYLHHHMKMHEEKKFACDKCDWKFAEKRKLDNHKLTHLPESEKKFPCNECGKFYANEVIRNQHYKTAHLRIYYRVCEICGRKFPDSRNFNRHMEKHEGIGRVKRSKCDICGLMLISRHSLKLHKEAKHPTERREYNCHICSKVCTNMRAVKRHIYETHKLDYRFKCTICEKEFKRADHFKCHMARHTGKPMYQCSWCPKKFNSNGNMYIHRKKAHPEEWEEAQRKRYSGNLPPNYKGETPASNSNNSALSATANQAPT
ncbi:transcription factor grauzone isoform X3 [Musca domestica]|uniref:Transcription factor grauzone isoform X3 n=1 Tax=Musca domestica TaxID=7370 RepID=A0ABM3VJX2_MUSDO|nr:transcription factor grauzone isoform X3 [Musca domestica]